MNKKQSIVEDFHLDMDEYKAKKEWSTDLANRYGESAALAFAIGADLLAEFCEEDLEALAKMPKDSHMGQLNCSHLRYYLPEQFLTRYNYEFYYFLRCRLTHLLTDLDNLKLSIIFDEIMLYIIIVLGSELIEADEILAEDYTRNWFLALFSDVHVTDLFYEDNYVDEADDYHFKNWFKELS